MLSVSGNSPNKMAIKETTKKIHFMPYVAKKGREKDTDPAPTVTVNRKYNYILFSKSAIKEMGLDGKFLHFYFEPIKKIIGWQVRETIQQSDMKAWRLVKAPKAGNWKTTIKKMLDEFNGRLTKVSYEALPVQRYREINPLSEYKNQVFYFIELIDNPEELKKGVGNHELGESTTT